VRSVAAGSARLPAAFLNLQHQLLARGLARARAPATVDLVAKGRQRRDVQRREDIPGGKGDQRQRADAEAKGNRQHDAKGQRPEASIQVGLTGQNLPDVGGLGGFHA
jgi:hypothetical protein